MMDAQGIVDQVQSEIGLDAYHIYPDSRRFIPEVVLWGIASACVIEFVKGFVDFKKLGEDARSKLNELLRRWKQKDDFEKFVESEYLEVIVYRAIETIPPRLSDAKIDAAREELVLALVEFGLSHDAARRQAGKISEVVLTNTGT